MLVMKKSVFYLTLEFEEVENCELGVYLTTLIDYRLNDDGSQSIDLEWKNYDLDLDIDDVLDGIEEHLLNSLNDEQWVEKDRLKISLEEIEFL